eukprot:scaffold116778_cov20-Tisochrysis_lutea.AAC.1
MEGGAATPLSHSDLVSFVLCLGPKPPGWAPGKPGRPPTEASTAMRNKKARKQQTEGKERSTAISNLFWLPRV